VKLVEEVIEWGDKTGEGVRIPKQKWRAQTDTQTSETPA